MRGVLQPFSRFHNEEKVDGDRDKEDDKQRGFDHFGQEFAAHPKPDSANLASQAARMKPVFSVMVFGRSYWEKLHLSLVQVVDAMDPRVVGGGAMLVVEVVTSLG